MKMWKLGILTATMMCCSFAAASTIRTEAQEIQSEQATKTGWQKDGENWYFYNADGTMQTGWKMIRKNWYYFNANGVMQTGWLQNAGKWYYFNESGQMQTGFQMIKNKRYYFGPSGDMKTGWVDYYGDWYYFDNNGAEHIGWLYQNGKWYYLREYRGMIPGSEQWEDLFEIGGYYYAFNSRGEMQTGWIKHEDQWGEAWHYADANGRIQTGWKMISGKWYYFQTKRTKDAPLGDGYDCEYGRMVTSAWADGYWLNADGTWTNKEKASWHKTGKGWWYGTGSWYAKSSGYMIDGISYGFDANGYLADFIEGWDPDTFRESLISSEEEPLFEYDREGIGPKYEYYAIIETDGKYYMRTNHWYAYRNNSYFVTDNLNDMFVNVKNELEIGSLSFSLWNVRKASTIYVYKRDDHTLVKTLKYQDIFTHSEHAPGAA